jgi:hypothetical protein
LHKPLLFQNVIAERNGTPRQQSLDAGRFFARRYGEKKRLPGDDGGTQWGRIGGGISEIDVNRLVFGSAQPLNVFVIDG